MVSVFGFELCLQISVLFMDTSYTCITFFLKKALVVTCVVRPLLILFTLLNSSLRETAQVKVHEFLADVVVMLEPVNCLHVLVRQFKLVNG